MTTPLWQAARRLAARFGLAGRPPEAKASATRRLVALHLENQAIWTPRNYEALAREAYGRNPVAFRCVRMIAEAAASVPWLLYEDARELDRHPVLSLLARPNPAQSGVELMEAFYGFLQVAGNAYLEAVSLDGEVRELYVLRPDRMRIVTGGDGWPSAYEYTLDGNTLRFPVPEEGRGAILHLKQFHPFNDHYGMSPLEAAAMAVDIHNAGGQWTKALLDNAARPSGALLYEAGEGAAPLSGEQFERLKAQLDENYQGAHNAGRPLLLEGGLKWESMSFTPSDMDFIDARHAAAREIALAFGVPPMLLGIPGDNTYANYREANLAFWRQTVLPLVNRTAAALTAWLAAGGEPALRLGVDLDQIEALSVEREALWRRVGAASFLSEAERRAAVGYGARAGAEDGS